MKVESNYIFSPFSYMENIAIRKLMGSVDSISINKNKIWADNYAIISETEVFTYGQLRNLISEMRTLLKGRSLIFHECSNSIAAIAGYCAFYNCNQVQFLLGEGIEDAELKYLVSLYNPRYLYIKASRKRSYCEWKCVATVKEYVLLESNSEIKYALHSELALLLSTSGSTGSKKYVRLSYQNVKANSESIAIFLELDSTERPVLTLPMQYAYGLSIINSHLMVGATLLVTDKNIMQKEFWNFIREKQATSISGTPYVYEILKKMGFLHKRVDSIKTMTQAGGKLSEENHKLYAEYANKNGIKFFVMYGQTEATARMTYLPYNKSLQKCGSIGIAIPGGEVSLIDENNQEMNDAFVEGEIVYRGPNVSLGYAEGYQDLGKGDERKGILYTGDIAWKDEEGCYYIVGRKKRFLKIYGNRISLDEIEQIIQIKFPEVDCCCCGNDDHIIVFLNNENQDIQYQIKIYIANKIKVFSKNVIIKYIDFIPRTQSGKVAYTLVENKNLY